MKPFRDWILGIDFIYPLMHGYLTQWDTFRSASRPGHLGVDLCGKVGDEALSCFPGWVSNIYPSAAPGGTTVEVKNNDEATIATYSHLGDLKVHRGDVVAMGQVLGVLAGVPKDKPRPHIHFQLKAWIDPETALRFPKKW
jgi:murein DD-endopeptidase MepM/ murein hydrolase activator NlpD